MHECPTCGLVCDCDSEDLYQAAPINCSCEHYGSGLDADGNELEDGGDFDEPEDLRDDDN